MYFIKTVKNQFTKMIIKSIVSNILIFYIPSNTVTKTKFLLIIGTLLDRTS